MNAVQIMPQISSPASMTEVSQETVPASGFGSFQAALQNAGISADADSAGEAGSHQATADPVEKSTDEQAAADPESAGEETTPTAIDETMALVLALQTLNLMTEPMRTDTGLPSDAAAAGTSGGTGALAGTAAIDLAGNSGAVLPASASAAANTSAAAEARAGMAVQPAAAQAAKGQQTAAAAQDAAAVRQAARLSGTMANPQQVEGQTVVSPDPHSAISQITGQKQALARATQIQLPASQTVSDSEQTAAAGSDGQEKSFAAVAAQAVPADSGISGDLETKSTFAVESLEQAAAGQMLAGAGDTAGTAAASGTAVLSESASLLGQVADNIDLAWQGNQQVLRVRLKPDSFGELQIRLSRGKDGLTARISTDNPATRHLLAGQIGQLQEALQEKGLNCRQIEIQYTTTDSGFDGSQSQQQKSGADRDSHGLFYESGGSRDSPEARKPVPEPASWQPAGKLNYLA